MTLTVTLESSPRSHTALLWMLAGAALLHIALLLSLQGLTLIHPKRPATTLQIQLQAPINQPNEKETRVAPTTQAQQQVEELINKESNLAQSTNEMADKKPMQPQVQNAPMPKPETKPVISTKPQIKQQAMRQVTPASPADLLNNISNEYNRLAGISHHEFGGTKQKEELNFDSKLFDLKLPQRLKEGSVETYTDTNGQPSYRMVVNGAPVCVSKHEFSFHDSFTPNVWKARPC